jgi:hypothetical protein
MAVNYQPMPFGEIAQFLTDGFASVQLSQVQAAAHIFGIKKAPFLVYEISTQLKSAMIVGLDMEWYESGPKRITELGISVLPVPQSSPGKPIHALNNMGVHHMRLKETAHMVNGEKCPGHPEAFQFGSTCFVNATEAKQALLDVFFQYDLHMGIRPVVLVGHAIDNDIDILRQKFDFDLVALGVVVLVLDTQVMAKELGMNSGNPMSLKNILAQYSVEEKYLHNAGNDIAQTMVAASLLAGEFVTHRGRYLPENQVDVANLNVMLRNQNAGRWGVPVFCTNCDSTEHFVGQCPIAHFCPRCANSPSWKHTAHTHPMHKCVRPAFPCQVCAESTDKRRQKNSMTHYIEDCHFDKSKS